RSPRRSRRTARCAGSSYGRRTTDPDRAPRVRALANETDLPLAELTLDRDVDDVADLAADHRLADRRRRRDHRQMAIAARTGQRRTRADRCEEERAALAGVGILDLDQGAERDR